MISREVKEVIAIMAAVIGLVLLLVTMFKIGEFTINYYDCETYSAATQKETVRTLSKCYVKTEKGLVEVQRYMP